MYRFLLRPIWLVSHVLVVTLVIVLFILGFWQLRRLDEKRDFNALVEARSEQASEPVTDVLAATDSFGDAVAVAFREVTAEGTYLVDDEVIVRSRAYEGQSGAWVLTPMLLEDGTAVVVNRGWVPLQAGMEPDPAWAPTTDRVEVEGLLVESQARGRFGAIDPEGERLETLARADVARLQQQVDEDLLPAVLQLDTQAPAPSDDFPVAIGPPELSEGPHLNYAGQWFIFGTIAAVGYPIILRRIARSKAAELATATSEAAVAGTDEPDPALVDAGS